MTAPWTLLSEKLQYDGYRKISRRVYRLPDGRDVATGYLGLDYLGLL